eukprot:6307245-Alexandrium_andersonii.AAC.1
MAMTISAFLSVRRSRRCRRTRLTCPTSVACRRALAPHTRMAAAITHSGVATSPLARGCVAVTST